MENLDFNKKFFAKSNAYIYKLALMFTKYGSTQMDVLEFLFFARKDAIVDNVNWLTFLEDFNDKYAFVNKWIQDLDNVLTEDDWFFHHHHLKTKMLNCAPMRQEAYIEAIKKFKEEKRVSASINNGCVLWNNMVYGINNAEYLKGSDKSWLLWDTLLKIRNGRDDFQKQDSSIIDEFDKIMHHRKMDDFYIKHNMAYNGKEDYVCEMRKNIQTVLSKYNLENSLSVKDTLKKIFKI